MPGKLRPAEQRNGPDLEQCQQVDVQVSRHWQEHQHRLALTNPDRLPPRRRAVYFFRQFIKRKFTTSTLIYEGDCPRPKADLFGKNVADGHAPRRFAKSVYLRIVVA